MAPAGKARRHPRQHAWTRQHHSTAQHRTALTALQVRLQRGGAQRRGVQVDPRGVGRWRLQRIAASFVSRPDRDHVKEASPAHVGLAFPGGEDVHECEVLLRKWLESCPETHPALGEPSRCASSSLRPVEAPAPRTWTAWAGTPAAQTCSRGARGGGRCRCGSAGASGCWCAAWP